MEDLENKKEKNGKPEEKICRYCCQHIPVKATVCHHCNKYQSLIWNSLNFFSNLAIIVSIIMALISYLNLQESKKQRITSSQALKKAEVATEKAQSAERSAVSSANNIFKIEKEVKKTNESINQTTIVAEQARTQLKEVNNITSEIQKKNRDFENRIKQANSDLLKIEEASEISLLVLKASNDDRDSFEKLFKMIQQPGPFQEFLTKVVLQIIAEVDSPMRFGIAVDWGKKYGINFDKYSLIELWKDYLSVDFREKREYISEVSKPEHLPKWLLIEFLIDIIKTEKSLRLVNEACRSLNKEAKINKNFAAAEEYLKWWDENKKIYYWIKDRRFN